MTPTLLTWLAHLAYLLMLGAFVARDQLYLRALLVAAQSLLVFYTWRTGFPMIASWNLLFAVINAFMAARIVSERRAVEIPAALRPVYERHFAALSPPEFVRWWRQGRRETLDGQRLASEGEHPESLYFILAGTVRVTRDRTAVVDLPAGYFVAEMSLMTGEPANADVEAVGPVEVMRWATRDLRELRERNPMLWTRIQSVIGHDLVEKMRFWEARTRAVA